ADADDGDVAAVTERWRVERGHELLDPAIHAEPALVEDDPPVRGKSGPLAEPAGPGRHARLVRMPGGRAVQDDGWTGHADQAAALSGHARAARRQAGGLAHPAPLAATNEGAEPGRHPREAGRLGVDVGDVVDEAGVRPTGRGANDRERDERLAGVDVGIG